MLSSQLSLSFHLRPNISDENISHAPNLIRVLNLDKLCLLNNV